MEWKLFDHFLYVQTVDKNYRIRLGNIALVEQEEYKEYNRKYPYDLRDRYPVVVITLDCQRIIELRFEGMDVTLCQEFLKELDDYLIGEICRNGR